MRIGVYTDSARRVWQMAYPFTPGKRMSSTMASYVGMLPSQPQAVRSGRGDVDSEAFGLEAVT